MKISDLKLIDWIALYVLCCGLWPLADPTHGFDTPLSQADVLLHIAAAIVFTTRAVKRARARSSKGATDDRG